MLNAGVAPGVLAESLTRRYRVGTRVVRALEDVTFAVEAGQTLAVIGESGSGKSTLTRVITGLEAPTSGRILVDGAPPHLRAGRPARAQLVFQDPAGSLNPYRKVWKSVAEPLRHMRSDARKEAAELMLARVGIEESRWASRPSKMSGGQLQRVAIARALVRRSKVLVCDEPTSALDVSVQAQILNLLQDLQEELGFSCVFVTHDLAVAQVVAHQVMVLRRGRLCELSPASSFFAGPRDPYSASLLDATSFERSAGALLKPPELRLAKPPASTQETQWVGQ